MDEQRIRMILEGGGGAAGWLARAGLWLPGKAYGAAMELRRLMYRAGLLASQSLPLPAVSVGNLAAGGSGKTPFVLMLAEYFLARGVRPGILLRGYRGAPGQGSDEALLYRNASPRSIVETGADRLASAARAAAAGAQALILDDGFQHLRARRDFDVVLIDARCPWGGGNTIPGGLLREPRSALEAADAVVATRSDQVAPERLRALMGELERLVRPGVLVHAGRHEPTALRTLAGRELPLADLAGRRVVAVAGIARPEAFAATLAGLGAEVAAERFGRDHDAFSPESIREAEATARRLDAWLVTTEKDRDKRVFRERLAETADNTGTGPSPWTWLEVRMRVTGGSDLAARVFAALGLPDRGNPGQIGTGVPPEGNAGRLPAG